MIVEYIRYDIASQDAEAFEADYARAGDSLAVSPHCLGYELSRCLDEPGCYILRIEWDSVEGHMQGFRQSSEFRQFFAAIKPHVNNILEMRHYEQVATVTAKAS
ncbi:antibiotic biosynthesis monooxygenase family protein [Rhodanobacter sp. Col0626]|uniref:antibiotic biosynthesis monooxygenase family protein n=1 Tax=Rhodanobacter sp. Col0626 TaxID=3415679 RepID=UPI003CE75690